ncbi:unknown [Prevotella sp. CAG:732]|nr:unknown [Prevotella sp. CAG:732]
MKLAASNVPAALKFWYPTLYIPKSNAGIKAITTKLMMRFESMASWMLAPLFAVVFGTYRKLSNPSKTLSKA